MHAAGTKSGFDPTLGFTVTNNTAQNVYVQTSNDAFEIILPANTSTTQTAPKNYPVRSDDNTNAPIFLTVQVTENGAVQLEPGTLRGDLSVFVNFK